MEDTVDDHDRTVTGINVNLKDARLGGGSRIREALTVLDLVS